MASQPKPGAIFTFGPFRLDAPAGVVTRDGVKLPLSARAFEVLHMLARREGGTVTRDELLAEVWRGVTVEENNLTVQVSALRRVLGDMPDQSPVIITVPNQGYRLAGPVVSSTAIVPDNVTPPTLPPTRPSVPGTGRRLWWAAGGLAIAIAAAAGILFQAQHDRPVAAATAAPQPTAPLLSLVILPFRNLATDHQDDPLADAVSDDLTTEMAHMPAATVIARETADSYQGRAVPTSQIGQALNVRYVLEGSLRGSAASVSVNAQLIDAATGVHVWARRFDTPRDPPGDLQPAIVYRIASGLRTALTADAAKQSLKEHPQNPNAMDFYVRARAIWEREESIPSMQSAWPLLEQAIKLQPDFVPALAELGAELTAMPDFNGARAGSVRLARAHEVVDRALGLAREDPAVLHAQGWVLLAENHPDQAEASFRAAAAIDPGGRGPSTGLWITAFERARWQEAYDALRHTQFVDPEGAAASFRDEQLGILSLLLGRPLEAETLIQKGLAAWPAPAPGKTAWDPIGTENLLLAAAHVMAGDVAGGRALMARGNAIWPHRTGFRAGEDGNKAMAQDPSMQRIHAALREAGLPPFADEYVDDKIPPTRTIASHEPLATPPLTVPGVPTIDTPALAKLVAAHAPLLIIDMGIGAVRPIGAVAGIFDPLSTESCKRFVATLPPWRGARSW
jgi:TolB-like protein/DNA-binding winged helix-turn-helix (wHTH) protein/Flp pilus assembly protein TadD